jgi:predicted PurR-regulated permease PerM
VIQEIENKVVTPLLMKRFMDMPPVLVIMSLLIGGTVFGFLGTLFSVPVFGIIYEFLKEFLEKRHTETVEY